MKGGELFAFAGLYTPPDPEEGVRATCAIITTTPNKVTAPIHNRHGRRPAPSVQRWNCSLWVPGERVCEPPRSARSARTWLPGPAAGSSRLTSSRRTRSALAWNPGAGRYGPGAKHVDCTPPMHTHSTGCPCRPLAITARPVQSARGLAWGLRTSTPARAPNETRNSTIHT